MSDWLIVSLLCVQTLSICGCNDDPARTEGDIGTNTPTVSRRTMPGMGGIKVMQQRPVDDVSVSTTGWSNGDAHRGRVLDMVDLTGGQPVLEMPTRPSQATGRPGDQGGRTYVRCGRSAVSYQGGQLEPRRQGQDASPRPRFFRLRRTR